jgi:hypothetical protein
MERKETNRAKQVSVGKEYQKGVQLIDVDTTIAEYMMEKIIPDVEENGNVVKVPLLYGNAERWNNARKDGYLRDQRGRIQIPLMMFKRNSIAKDSSIPQLKEVNTLPAYRKYSVKSKYERFSLINGATKPYEQYSVSVPSYVTITYEVMIWTSFTEHMNKITEAFQYASDTYWGNEDKFKFRTFIDSFDNQQEVGEGSERVIRTTFTMIVHAYLLPEIFADKPTTKKSLSPKRVVFGVETDLSGNLFANPTLYNEYQDAIDFVGIRGSQLAEYVNLNQIRLTNVRLPILPPQLAGSFDTRNWFRVYVNGIFEDADTYTYTFDGVTNVINFVFTLPYNFESSDEIYITGKFIEL